MTTLIRRVFPTDSLLPAVALAGIVFLVSGCNAEPASAPPAATAVDVTVRPISATTAPASVIPFAAAVTGTTNRTVTWTVLETGGGTVDGAGLYTAPSTTGVFHVVVTSTADPTKTATAQVTVTTQPTIAVSISPPSATTATGGTVAFTAIVTGTSGSQSTAANWSVQEAGGGTVDGSGRYSAPTSAGTFHVIATSVADSSKSTSAAVVVTSSGGGSTDIIPASRRTVWSPGIPGGIPVRNTICATVTPAYASAHGLTPFATDGTGNAQPAIQYAMDNCPTGQVVYLPAGTYRINSELDLQRSITLRGAGAKQTKLRSYANYIGIWMWPASGWPQYGSAVRVTADVPKGATTIPVASAASFNVGDIIQIDQTDDTSYLFYGDCPWFKRPDYGPPTASPRSMGQTLEITGKSGNDISVSPQIHLGFTYSHSPEVFKPTNTDFLKFAGVEDLYITGGQGSMIYMLACAYCWVKNVESDGTSPGGRDGTDGPGLGMGGEHLLIERSFRAEVRGSYFHHASSVVEGGGAYGISLSQHTSDSLIEDNIIYWMNKPLTMRASGGGNVVAYNYVDDAWTHNAPNMMETTIDMAHASFPYMELVEGNYAPQIATDVYWGNSGWMTVFRNYASSQHRRGGEDDAVTAINLDAKAVETNVVGNVLGMAGRGLVYEVHSDPPGRAQPAVWRIGGAAPGGGGGGYQTRYEPYPFVPTDGGIPTSGYTLLRVGNYDYVRNQIDTDPGVPLPNSLYLTSKPAFFGSNPWPWVDPSGTTKVAVLPAKQRFDAGTPVP